MLRYLTAGESHGPALTAIVEGMPAGVSLDVDFIDHFLQKRQAGYGRGGRMRIEKDRVIILSGVRRGVTTGAPVSLMIKNRDWENWQDVMEAEMSVRRVTRPRPGHADLAGGIKYRHRDLRNVLERASARETAIRVAAAAVGRSLLEQLEIRLVSQVIRIGRAAAPSWQGSAEELTDRVNKSEVFCADPAASQEMMKVIDEAADRGDTVGGVFEIIVWALPVGLGSYVQWDRRLDGRLAQALMSIQGIKGVEIGLGFEAAAEFGSEVHDALYHSPELGYYRKSNRAGGLEGGVTNGEPLVVRAAMKPIPTLMRPLPSVDIETKEGFEAAVERSDTCAVPAASVVGEAIVAWELAVVLLEKFPGDHLEEIKRSLAEHRIFTRNY